MSFVSVRRPRRRRLLETATLKTLDISLAITAADVTEPATFGPYLPWCCGDQMGGGPPALSRKSSSLAVRRLGAPASSATSARAMASTEFLRLIG
jgi:hypothetical protein